MNRYLRLVGMVHPPTSKFSESWRNPLGRADFLDSAFTVDIARTLERGRFDAVFFADSLAIPEDAHGDIATTLETGGKGSLQLDPIALIAHVAAATQRIGLGATVSTSFVPPYTIARQLLSVDHLSGGRVAWNIVTSTTDAEARNHGLAAIPSRSERYDRADAVVQAVVDLWGSWDADALALDRGGTFADPAKVHRTPGRSAALTRGPLQLPPSRQRHPVLMQAGASPRGQAFAARWAELVFAVAADADTMREMRTELRERARIDYGRDPDSIQVLQGIQPILGWNDAAAGLAHAQMREQIDLDAATLKLARLFQAEPASIDRDARAVEFLDAHRGATGSEGFERMLADVSAAHGYTVADLAVEQAISQLVPQPIGSAATVADTLEELFRSGAADGFVIYSPLMHSSLEEFVAGVVPELQQRGLVRRDYTGTTLREHLLEQPAD